MPSYRLPKEARTGKAPVWTTLLGPHSASSQMKEMKRLEASALASSPLSNTQKPLTRYSSSGTPSSEGKGTEIWV